MVFQASRRQRWDFDIDHVLNRFVPPPPWRHVPYPIAHFLGHRRGISIEIGIVMRVFWAFLGIFGSLAAIEAASLNIPSFESKHVPVIVGSFGAAAVLEFLSIDSPLAQPRNAILGQLMSSITGVAICKLFQLSDHFTSIRWIGGALACATATSLMAMTKTVHPPAGATALLAVVDENLSELGWFLVPVMMLGCAIMLAVALVINNIERRFPVYWWTAADLAQASMWVSHHPEKTLDGDSSGEDDGDNDLEAAASRSQSRVCVRSSEASAGALSSSIVVPDGDEGAMEATATGAGNYLLIEPGAVSVPAHMSLTAEERTFLDRLSERLKRQ